MGYIEQELRGGIGVWVLLHFSCHSLTFCFPLFILSLFLLICCVFCLSHPYLVSSNLPSSSSSCAAIMFLRTSFSLDCYIRYFLHSFFFSFSPFSLLPSRSSIFLFPLHVLSSFFFVLDNEETASFIPSFFSTLPVSLRLFLLFFSSVIRSFISPLCLVFFSILFSLLTSPGLLFFTSNQSYPKLTRPVPPFQPLFLLTSPSPSLPILSLDQA